MLDSLYNTDILTLSAGLKNTALTNADASARKVSKLCGSWLEIDVIMNGDAVGEIALRLQACALGQAAAAILQEAVIGATLAELQNAQSGLRAMLKDGADAPLGRFSKLALLKGVADYPARHTSTMLAFDAAVDAVSAAVGT